MLLEKNIHLFPNQPQSTIELPNVSEFFLQPLMKNLSLCSVLDYVVEHNTSENITWSDYVENDTAYTFSWTEDVHAIKVLAVNSIGTSSVNFILTLSQQISTGKKNIFW